MKNIAEFWAKLRVKSLSILSSSDSFNNNQHNYYGPVVFIDNKTDVKRLKPYITNLIGEKNNKSSRSTRK